MTEPSRVATLRAELRDDTAFVATPTPRLSWTVESDEPGWLQASVELTRRPRDRDPRRARERARRVAVRPARTPASARDVTRARARRCRARRPRWSEPLRVEAGFLADGEWVAAADRPRTTPTREAQPALLRTTFTLDRAGASAPCCSGPPSASPSPSSTARRSRTTSSRPGWTSYRDRLVHETVDVTALVREGENVLGATVAGGWYTEKYGFFDLREPPLRHPAVVPRRSCASPTPTASTATLAATGDGWTRVRRRPDRRQRHLPRRAPGPAPRRARLVDAGVDRGLDARARRRRRAPRLRERAGARGAHRAARAPHPDPRRSPR